MKNLSSLFNPRSVAIVGAAREPNKLGNLLLKNIQSGGFTGPIYPVNPKADVIEGVTCYPAYDQIPAVPDLAIIVVPAEIAMELLPVIARHGTKNIIILSAGFKEIGGAGKEREVALQALATEYHLNIVGPNCLGLLHTPAKLNATFGQPSLAPGNLRFVLQSGALATSLFDWAKTADIGLSSCVTLGNKAVLTENDILSDWLRERRTTADTFSAHSPSLSSYRPIGLYLESIENGQEFIRLARELSRTTPLFILKPGASSAAKSAMHSHTGAIAGNEAIISSACAEAGLIRCAGLEDFFDLAKAFTWENPPRGSGVAIVSNAGGPAVLATDALVAAGLTMAPITQSTKRLLAAALPRAASLQNPVDVLGDALADRYQVALEAVLKERGVHAAVVILTPQVMTEIEATAKSIGELARRYGKPVFCSFMGGSLISKGEAILNQYRLPSFRYPERAINALAAMWRWQAWRTSRLSRSKTSIVTAPTKTRTRRIQALLDAAKEKHEPALSSAAAQTVVREWGIPVPREAEVRSAAGAVTWAKRNGPTVVLKISSATVLHKTEQRAVLTNLATPAQISGGVRTLQTQLKKLGDPEATIRIQEYTAPGAEVIIGFKRDASFGPVLLFGWGGIMAELVADQHIALFPLTPASVEALIDGTRMGKVLRGYRTGQSYPIETLVSLIIKLSELFSTFPEIKELEINPVILTAKKIYAVDTKIVLLDK